MADEVLRHRESGTKLKSQSVLFRTSTHSASLELELARRNIPFVKFGGLKFLEAAHVKDMMAILRFAENPRGRMAGFRVLNLIAGIGQASATRLLDAMGEAADPVDTLRTFTPPPNAKEGWSQFAQLYLELREKDLAWPADMERAKDWYLPQLERLHDDAPVRKLDVDQLTRLATGYASRERFLTELTLDPPQSSSDESGVPHRDEDYLILSTIHSAKGQEWNAVHILNVVDGCMPADMATGSAAEIEEERRLLYVAMTRAKDELSLWVPQRFHVTQQRAWGDRHMYALRSRFLPDAVLGHFDSIEACAPAPPAAPAGTAAAAPLFDLGAALRGGWPASGGTAPVPKPGEPGQNAG